MCKYIIDYLILKYNTDKIKLISITQPGSCFFGLVHGVCICCSDEGYIESSTELTRMIVAPNDMGDIAAVKVTYEKSSCLSCFLYSDFVRLQHVEIKEGERQKK